MRMPPAEGEGALPRRLQATSGRRQTEKAGDGDMPGFPLLRARIVLHIEGIVLHIEG